ncbi:glycosyltransferase family 2 protein [Parvibaculum sp.]|uniref:glycosyltransferase family 2 protein n=1 Tax=Parvibaculum sp. TaxID=2024848 RepID=UPI002CC7BAA1|nr:glycosyltransferase family 2 protein [Parvibaculum sp.]HUD53366.1 glycosyltransferase family 2 protein [Parvibaculum sp.]
MKVIIQIPCFNEEDVLPITLAALPKTVPGIDEIEVLVVDDGSTDRTAEIARRHGVHHVISHVSNRGLAQAFMTGLQAALDRGADIVVNTDADNQYCADDIPLLIQPILENRALIVVGARAIDRIEHFSIAKKILQKLGSAVVRFVSKTDVADAPSGFRAMHREAAEKLFVYTTYTYTLETIVQAGRKNIPIISVPIRTNGDLRPSRLVKSIPSYINRSIITIFRVFVLYKPLRFFSAVGGVLGFVGLLIGLRYLFVLAFEANPGAHIQSLILMAVLIFSSGLCFVAGLIGDVVAANRLLLEDIRTSLRGMRADRTDEQDGKHD